MSQVRVETTDLITVKVITDNLEGSYNKTEAKDLSIVNVNVKLSLSKRHISTNRTQYGNNRKPYFQGNQTNSYKG